MKALSVISLLLLIGFCSCRQITDSNGQTTYSSILSKEIIHKAVPIIKQRNLVLNGGARAAFGGKSRTYIEVDIPKNTIEWYYSFTSSANDSGNLNLAIQLAELLKPIKTILGISGITQEALSNIHIPKGSHVLDVYLLDESNIKSFLDKDKFTYQMNGSLENTTQCTNIVSDHNNGRWFLGLKNPSTLNAVNIKIEVVAIVEE